MTTNTDTFPDRTGFRRGHRVRFANGPVMTVMDYAKNEFDEILITCGWWRPNSEIEIVNFHPSVLIHTDAACDETFIVPTLENSDDFKEFHSG